MDPKLKKLISNKPTFIKKTHMERVYANIHMITFKRYIYAFIYFSLLRLPKGTEAQFIIFDTQIAHIQRETIYMSL